MRMDRLIELHLKYISCFSSKSNFFEFHSITNILRDFWYFLYLTGMTDANWMSGEGQLKGSYSRWTQMKHGHSGK